MIIYRLNADPLEVRLGWVRLPSSASRQFREVGVLPDLKKKKRLGWIRVVARLSTRRRQLRHGGQKEATAEQGGR